MDLVAIKTSELIGPALDWAVATIDYPGDGYMNAVVINRKHAPSHRITVPDHDNRCYKVFRPSTDWSQGGPLIEKHGIEVFCNLSAEQASRFKDASPDWRACMNRGRSEHSYGLTPLIAAMRCLVASKLGDTVQTPSELIQ